MWEWLSDRLLHDGILVRALTDPDERALKDVASALDVVKRVDPRTYRLAARLMNCGIGYEEALRFRVEQVCQRRELAFARLLVAQDPEGCLLYTSPSPRDRQKSRMPSSA